MSSMIARLRDIVNYLLNIRNMVVTSSVLFFFTVGVAFFMIYQNAGLMRDQINDDFNEQQLILGRQAAAQIDAMLHDIEIEMESVKRLLVQESGKPRREAMQAVLERTRSKGLMEIGIMDSEGRIIESYSDADIARPAPLPEMRDECKEGDSAHVALGPLRVLQIGPDRYMVTSVFCSPIAFEDGHKEVLFARVDVSRLVASVTGNIRSGKTGYAWVIDEKGTFLYHPEQEFIGMNAFTVRKERKPYISFVQINRIMKDSMLKGEEGTATYVSGWHRGIQGKMTKLIAFTPVRSASLSDGHAWAVAVVAPTSEVAEAVHKVYSRHIKAEAALIAGMFVFGVLAAIYHQRISQALKERVKRTEADLQETERTYQRVVEQATDLIYILDPDMRVVLLNRHTIQTFSNLVVTETEGGAIPADADLTRAELYVGRRLDELFRPVDAAFMRKQIDKVLELRSSHSYEHTLDIKGRRINLNTKLVPIRGDQDEVRQILGISRDVTEKREMDQRIYNTEKLASIGTLAAGVAHEINNPLAVILGFTDLLLDQFKEGAPEYEDLKVIEYNANSAKKIVEKMLGFARITEGLEDTVDIYHSVDTVTNIVKNTLMTKKIDLVMDVPEKLSRVRGDPREFQQVIFNLINNSVAAMEEKGGTLRLSATDDNGWVHVSISDTGVGIPDKLKPQIFDPFFTTKKVGEGTGLGLSLCYGIVKKYGGKINFTSTSAQDNPNIPSGTTFTVSMPVQMPVEWRKEGMNEAANSRGG
ncbi:PAS domain-containing protein [Candidatus Poribacteria bacterium]|nr:PAS domain-containing protein [Candidatus Poribacteria bacterium]